MRTSFDALMWHIMNATADDWESLDQIQPDVETWLGPSARNIIAELIVQLIDDGLMEEMKHTPVTATQVLATPTKFWFSMSPAGKKLWDLEGVKYRG